MVYFWTGLGIVIKDDGFIHRRVRICNGEGRGENAGRRNPKSGLMSGGNIFGVRPARGWDEFRT